MTQSISLVGICTHDRSFALRRCIVSYAKHLLAHSRVCELYVIDDSQDPGQRAARRVFLENVRSSYGFTCRYFGFEEKKRFTADLARYGISKELIAFAIGNPLGIPSSPGGNRNMLLLRAAAKSFLSVDDDSTCSVYDLRAPDSNPTLTNYLSTSARMTLIDDARTFMKDTQQAKLDLLSVHEECLGKNISDLVRVASKAGETTYATLGSRITSDLLSGCARVAATTSGVIGDSGLVTITPIVLAQHEARKRFMTANIERFRSAGPVLIGNDRPFISACGPMVTTTATGFDGSQCLPPFPPSGRGEDTVWGRLLNACCPRDYIGHLAIALPHAIHRRRNLSELPTQPKAADFLTYLLRGVPAPLGSSMRKRMQDIGLYFFEAGGLDAAEFKELVRDAARYWLINNIQSASLLLKRYGPEPDYWARSLQLWIRQLETSVRSPMLPSDINDLMRFQAFVRLFGVLLKDWLQIRAACISLNKTNDDPL